ncbi:hypothetical protein DH2020_001633 [Rehmannia glutinosa]|uniref:indole-3-pyruvate monooxygenase n=1 Tax=Rehmannia glutinosa TaxID=99300 RepID=A0ABR0Y076_REHGL
MAEQTETTVIIVGGGPSGLATAAYLHHLSIPYILLEREDCFASLWQKYSYDRVHLHLAKQFCELPLMPIPQNYPTYLSKNQFTRYLNDYVSRFGIDPTHCRRKVETASYDEIAGKWKIGARNLKSGEIEEYRSRFLVVATGETCDASVPKVEGLRVSAARFCTRRNSYIIEGMAYAGLVLVKYLPFKWVDSMVTIMSKIVFGDLTKYGIQRPKEGPFALKVKYGKYPVIDVGTLHKIKTGEIQVLPGIKSVKGNNVLFENGKEYPFDVMVFATGFKRSTREWLNGYDSLLTDDGLPKQSFPNHWKGQNGLYCAGLARRGLYGAAMDAQNIAHDIKTLV